MAKGPDKSAAEIAAAGTAANNANANYNTSLANANYYAPQGNVTTKFAGWEQITDPQTGKVSYQPKYSHTVAPSKEELAIYKTGRGTRQAAATTAGNQMAAASGRLSNPYEITGPDWQYYDDPGFNNMYNAPLDQQGMIDQMMTSYNRAADPQNAAARTRLAVQGAGPGTMQDFRQGQKESDALGEFQRQSQQQAFNMSNEALKLRNEALQGDLENRWKQQSQWNDTKGMENELNMNQRNQWINEISAMMGLGQAEFPQSPGYQAGQSQPVDVAGLMSKENDQKMQAQNEMMKGIFGIGGQLAKLAFA